MRCCCEKTLRKNGRLGTPHPKPAEGLLLLRRWNQDQGIEFNAPLLMNWRIEQEMIDFWLFWTIGDRFGPCRSILDWLEPFWHYFWPILDIFLRDGKSLLTVLNRIRGQPRLFLTIWCGGSGPSIWPLFNLFWGQIPIFSWVTPTFFALIWFFIWFPISSEKIDGGCGWKNGHLTLITSLKQDFWGLLPIS